VYPEMIAEKEGNNHKKHRKICFVAAIELSLCVFMVEHIRKLSNENTVTVVVNTKNKEFLKPYGLDVKVVPVNIKRKPSPFSDIWAMFILFKLFRGKSFDIVHSITPKAGFVSMLAAYLAGVPIRIHTFTGQVWVNGKGIRRLILKNTDKLIALCATHILTDSKSQQDFIIKENIVLPGKSFVIGNGSICGVDGMRFKHDLKARAELRRQFNISEDNVLFLFLGRLNADKGLLDLALAFSKLSESAKNAYLLIVGPDEEGIKNRMLTICSNCIDKIFFYDFTDKPERFMAAADVLCLPSYREGFGLVVIEAGSVGIPSIATSIYGITDAIEDGSTGFLFKPGDIDSLTQKMSKMIEDPALRESMGINARQRTSDNFSKELVTSAFIDYYTALPHIKSN